MSDGEVTTRLARLEAHNARLEARVSTLEGGRPGRRALPVVISAEGVCGVDPDRDSSECPDASLYRRQKGCKGTRCVALTQEYYGARRKAK